MKQTYEQMNSLSGWKAVWRGVHVISPVTRNFITYIFSDKIFSKEKL